MKNTLIWICRIFIGLVASLLLMQGFMWSFLPEANLATNGIVVDNTLGINMIKTDIGAGLFTVAIFSFLYLFRGVKWFMPLVIAVSGYLIIRTISFFVDGYHETVVIGIGLEAIVLVALLGLNKLQKTIKE